MTTFTGKDRKKTQKGIKEKLKGRLMIETGIVVSVLFLVLDEVLDFRCRLDNGSILFLLCIQNLRVLEMLNKTTEALKSRICQDAYLFIDKKVTF